MERRFRFISPLFLFLLITFMVASLNVHVQPVYALGQAGWDLVKQYTFTGSLNQSEWEIWKFPSQADNPTVVNNKLKLSIPNNVGSILTHPECSYVSAVKTKLLFAPSMKIRINASFENAIVNHIMIGFWLCHDTDSERNEIAFEYHGTWKVTSNINDVHPSIYYKSRYGQIIYWTCRYNHQHVSPSGNGTDYGYISTFDYWHGWHEFDIDIGYVNATHKYVVHYIDGNQVFSTGYITDIPTLPMWLYIGISVPAWEQLPPSGAYILVDSVKIYYWMDKLDNGNFENGMTYWDYKNFQAIDYDSDGDKEAEPTNLAEYWFGQQICYIYENLLLTWKLRLLLANTGGVIRFWFRNPYEYNMSLALTYVGNGRFEVKWSIITSSQYIERVNYYSLLFNQWLDCYFRKDGSLLEYQIGNNKLAISIPELARVCVAGFIGLDGYQQNFLVDDFSIVFNILSANYATVKLTSIGAGEVLPERGFYIFQKNSTITVSSYPLNSSYYTKWNIKSGTTNYNVTCRNLNLIIDKDYEITAYFVFGVANKTYQINYENLYAYERVYGYAISYIKGSTNPTFGIYDNPGTVQQLSATAFNSYFFYRWIGQRENGAVTYFPINQNVISVNFSETPYWTNFKAVFASAKVTIKTNIAIKSVKVSIYDNGEWHPLNLQIVDSTSANIYLKKGRWTLQFSAEGYYSKTVDLTVDEIAETLNVNLASVVIGGGGGGGGGGPPLFSIYSEIYVYELSINNSEFATYTVWDGAITISTLQNRSIYLKVTVHLDYPIVEIYARNITDIQINVPTLYSMLGHSIPENTFFAIVVDTDATLTVHAALPSQPKECYKTKPNSVHPVKIGDWTWDDGVLTFTVYSEDPAFSFIYASPGGIADLTNTLVMVAVTLAMMSVIFGMIRKWVG